MKNKKIIILRIVIIILIILWMDLVFGFSAQNSIDSSNLSLKIASWFGSDIGTQQFLEPYIRKVAHYSEYILGGGLFLLLFSTFKLGEKKQMLLSSLLGIGYAITDEIHQLFVPGRTGQLKDVYIDSLGVITGVFVMKLCVMIYNIVKNRRKK